MYTSKKCPSSVVAPVKASKKSKKSKGSKLATNSDVTGNDKILPIRESEQENVDEECPGSEGHEEPLDDEAVHVDGDAVLDEYGEGEEDVLSIGKACAMSAALRWSIK